MNKLPEWIATPELRPTWAKVRDRFEKAGLQAQGRVQVTVATRAQRHAVGELLGRTVTGEKVRIDLAELDQRLAERSGVGGLVAVLTALDGRAPQNRPAARAARNEAREQPLRIAASQLQTPWAAEWIAWLRSTGVLTARADAQRCVQDAVTVLQELTANSAPPTTRSRVEIGARLLGDAHALDRDRLLHRLVLRGLAAAAAVPMPESSQEVERLWAQFGIEPDLLSRTCLVWRLRASGDGSTAGRINEASAAGDPIHLTEWDVRRIESVHPVAAGRVLVCENPRVLEAFAERGLPGWSVVCTAGEPNLVVDRVLGQLAAAGAKLRYHGDFDWAGVAIANRVLQRTGAQAWLMTRADYLRAVRPDGPELVGRMVSASWDPTLAEAMHTQGRGVHEEAVLTQLLDAAARESTTG